MNDFVSVAGVNDVQPGKMACVQVNGNPVLLANIDGQFFAVSDTCTHEDASLCTGALKGGYVTCPLHGSRFHLKTGEPMEEPADAPLALYDVRVEGEDVLVSLKAHSPSHSD